MPTKFKMYLCLGCVMAASVGLPKCSCDSGRIVDLHFDRIACQPRFQQNCPSRIMSRSCQSAVAKTHFVSPQMLHFGNWCSPKYAQVDLIPTHSRFRCQNLEHDG